MKPSSVFDYVARSEGGAIETSDGDVMSMYEAGDIPLAAVTGICVLGAIGVAYRNRAVGVMQAVTLKLARSLGFDTNCSCLKGADVFGCACTADLRASHFVADWHDEDGRTLGEIKSALLAIGE